MKKTNKKPAVPMFARYLRGPELAETRGGAVREHVLLGGSSGGGPVANSSTHNGDFDY